MEENKDLKNATGAGTESPAADALVTVEKETAAAEISSEGEDAVLEKPDFEMPTEEAIEAQTETEIKDADKNAKAAAAAGETNTLAGAAETAEGAAEAAKTAAPEETTAGTAAAPKEATAGTAAAAEETAAGTAAAAAAEETTAGTAAASEEAAAGTAAAGETQTAAQAAETAAASGAAADAAYAENETIQTQTKPAEETSASQAQPKEASPVQPEEASPVQPKEASPAQPKEASPVQPVVPPVQKAEPRAKKKKKHHPVALALTIILLLAFLGGVGAVYYHYVQYFADHFYSGTTINGKDVSYETVDDVKQQIESDISKYTLTITERDDKTETLTAEDVGWAYVDDKKVDDLMAQQDHWKWFLSISKSKKYDVTAGTTYDKSRTEAAIDKLSCLQEANVTKPSDAQLVQTSATQYSITPETTGNEVDKDKLTEQVMAALDSGAATCSIVDPDCYIYPTVYGTNEALVARMNAWNTYLAVNVTYTFGSHTETINADTVRPYISDNGQEVTESTDWIKSLVYAWGSKYDTFGLARQFTTHAGNVITIPAGGDYGWCINKDKTIADVTDAVTTGATGSRDPVFLFSAMGWDNNDLTGTYVEVSIQDQKLWCYKNGQVVMETDVVTGLPTAERETKTGCWAVDAKKEQATLGTLDVQGYSQPVNYWAPFDGGQGLHDAPWRSTFGGTIYQTNGSHGCVNIPEANMKTIFDTISIGTAVVVY